ncbi:MAG TPA: hypothetical protein VMW17_23700 [Candidatus Binatia bacterium]|nr:hypothetical protein [Candidatus Binatia bacterium]
MERQPRRGLDAIADVTARDRVLIAARHGGTGMDEAPDKVAALVDTARVLDALPARYALIGGVAVGIHSGVPRATADTDIAVHSQIDREAVSHALVAAGFRRVGAFRHRLNFRHASGEPIQLVFDAAFDPMIERAEHLDVAGVRVPIVRKPDLIELKSRAGADPARRRSKALQDQADVELLRGDAPDPDEGW